MENCTRVYQAMKITLIYHVKSDDRERCDKIFPLQDVQGLTKFHSRISLNIANFECRTRIKKIEERSVHDLDSFKSILKGKRLLVNFSQLANW